MAQDTEVTGGHLWKAGRAGWGRNYVLLFMKMALWMLVKALSLTQDPSNPAERDTAICRV